MKILSSHWVLTGEALKPWVSKVMPNFEEIVKEFTHDGSLSKQAQARFRKVLGMLAWVALSRSDLTFSVSYLARGQADPRQSLEACMRSLLRWLQVGENLHNQQRPEGRLNRGIRFGGCMSLKSFKCPLTPGCLCLPLDA